MRQHRVADSGSMGWLPQTAYKIKYFKNKRINLCGLRPTRLRSFGAARFLRVAPLSQAVCWYSQLVVKQQIETPARGVPTPSTPRISSSNGVAGLLMRHLAPAVF